MKRLMWNISSASLLLLTPLWGMCGTSEALLKALNQQDATKVMHRLEAGDDANAQNEEGQKPLHIAAKAGDTMSARALLKFGAVIDGLNKYGETPMMIAAIQGHAEMVKLLHRYNAHINPTTEWTPLCYAATSGHIPILQYLIQNGADLDRRCVNGISPLMMAIRQNQPATALYLLEQGANATDQSADGRSIWQWATQYKQTEVLKKLRALQVQEN